MARKIDLIALTLTASAALWLIFMDAFGSIPIAAILTFITMISLRKIIFAIPWSNFSRPRRAKQAAANSLKNLTLKDPAEARREIAEIIKKSYPGEKQPYSLSIILRHPSGQPITPDEIIGEWKSRKSSHRLVIAATVKASKESLSLCESLENPKIRLIDAPGLISMLAKQNPDPKKAPTAPKRTLKKRLSSIFAAASRARPGKCSLYSILMALLFFLTASPAYLAACLVLIFIAAIALKHRSLPKTLFPE